MALIFQQAVNSVTRVLAQQWNEYYYCDALAENVLVMRGKKQYSPGFSGNRGSDSIISNGSIVVVADGQCALLVNDGKAIELCAEPGAYRCDFNSEPSLFDGGKLSTNIKAVFEQIGSRFFMEGEKPQDQRIYYFNLRNFGGSKFFQREPISSYIVDRETGIHTVVQITCSGGYSYKIVDPILFHANVLKNAPVDYTKAQLELRLRPELLKNLERALDILVGQGIDYYGITTHTEELTDAMRELLSDVWCGQYGVELVSMSILSVIPEMNDAQKVRQLRKETALPVEGTIKARAISSKSWKCPSCGTNSDGKFCRNCGTKRPEETQSWTCSCGTENSGKFCSECGQKRPEKQEPWICSCGNENQGKFCSECGAKRISLQ